MILLMNCVYRDVEIGDTVYKDVSLSSWRCWEKFFRWLYEQGAEMSIFQGGQAARVESCIKSSHSAAEGAKDE